MPIRAGARAFSGARLRRRGPRLGRRYRLPAGALPAITDAVAIDWDLGPPLVAEVQQHLGPAMVRVVALGGTAGLRRGTGVRALGAPIRAPVGDAVLGRLLNAIGEPVDRGR